MLSAARLSIDSSVFSRFCCCEKSVDCAKVNEFIAKVEICPNSSVVGAVIALCNCSLIFGITELDGRSFKVLFIYSRLSICDSFCFLS